MSPPYTRRSGWYASTEFRNLRKHTSEPCKSLTKNIRCVPTRKPSAIACHIVLGGGTCSRKSSYSTRGYIGLAPVDQLEDRYLGMVEAVGSNPTRSTFR